MEAADRVRLELEQALTERDEARTRAEADQLAIKDAARARAELEQVLAAERDLARGRADEDQRRAAEAQRTVEEAQRRADQAQRRADEVHQRIEEEQRRAAEEINQVRASFEATRAADLAAHETARSAAPVHADRLVAALREIDSADSVSATLAAIRRAAGLHAARAAVFVAGEQLREWETPGVESLSPAPLYVRDSSIGIVGEAVRRRAAVRAENGGAPAVAGLSVGRMAVATPLLLDGQAWECSTAMKGSRNDRRTMDRRARRDCQSRFREARIHHALRTAQANKWLNGSKRSAATVPSTLASDDEEQAAKHYARLLVSEIKLYNEAAVSAGRESADLLRRLGPDIDRAGAIRRACAGHRCTIVLSCSIRSLCRPWLAATPRCSARPTSC